MKIKLIDNLNVYRHRKKMCWPTHKSLFYTNNVPNFEHKSMNSLCRSTSEIKRQYTVYFFAHFYKLFMEVGNICVEQHTENSVWQTQSLVAYLQNTFLECCISAMKFLLWVNKIFWVFINAIFFIPLKQKCTVDMVFLV